MNFVTKISGFPFIATDEEIMSFLGLIRLENAEIFLSVADEHFRHSFDGTIYVFSSSSFDLMSLRTLHGKKYRENLIHVERSSFEALANVKLFPRPSDEFYKLLEKFKPKLQSQVSIRKRIQPPQPEAHKQPFDSNPLPQKNGLQTVNHNEPPDKKFKVSSDVKRDVNYNNFVKIIYGETMNPIELHSFLYSISLPSKIYYARFGFGPHAAEYRGEAFVEYRTQREANSFITIQPNSLKNSGIIITIPSTKELDSILFQYQNQSFDRSQEEVSNNTLGNQKMGSHENTCLANHIKVTNDYIPQKDNTYLNDLHLNKLDNQMSFVRVKIDQVNPDANLKDIELFFASFLFVPGSITKLGCQEKRAQWEVLFYSQQEAERAVKKLNYEIIRRKPVEVQIVK